MIELRYVYLAAVALDRLCPCGRWHWYDVPCRTDHSDPLTAEEYAKGLDR